KALAACAFLAGLDLWLLAELREPAGVFAATLFFWMVTGPMLLLGTTIAFTHLERPEKQFGAVRLWGTVGWGTMVLLVAYLLAGPVGVRPAGRGLRPTTPRRAPAGGFRLGGLIPSLRAVSSLPSPPPPPRRPASPHQTPAPLQAIQLLRKGTFATYCACALG